MAPNVIRKVCIRFWKAKSNDLSWLSCSLWTFPDANLLCVACLQGFPANALGFFRSRVWFIYWPLFILLSPLNWLFDKCLNLIMVLTFWCTLQALQEGHCSHWCLLRPSIFQAGNWWLPTRDQMHDWGWFFSELFRRHGIIFLSRRVLMILPHLPKYKNFLCATGFCSIPYVQLYASLGSENQIFKDILYSLSKWKEHGF